MDANELYQRIEHENIYSTLFKAEEHFKQTPHRRDLQEKIAPCYSVIVAGKRVLATRELTGMNVEQFRYNHRAWSDALLTALAEAVDQHGFQLPLSS